jgi:serine/threonine protein kinase
MPDATPSRPSADRNLLFGILALQMDFITRDALIRAMNAWVMEKSKSLGQILADQEAIRADARSLLEQLVLKHLELHENDPERSLASVGSIGSVRQELKQVKDPDVQASLVHLSVPAEEREDPWKTSSAHVHPSTSFAMRYRLLRPHATGGLGQVSVAYDEELHREVALKEIQDRYADDPHARARFVFEAEITGQLAHPSIVPVYGFGRYPDGRPYYAMRFIEGDSLRDAVLRFHARDVEGWDPGDRNLEHRRLVGHLVAACNAVAFAHSRGVLHRDIKPSNIMIGGYGETLVVDWGMAKVLHQAGTVDTSVEPLCRREDWGDFTATRPGSAMGTLQFMSPEQAAGDLERLGPTSDVYSLGATLYFVLTGQAPFEGLHGADLLHQVRQGDFSPPHCVKKGIQPRLEAICLKAMAKVPEGRYTPARAMAQDLERWLAGREVVAHRERQQPSAEAITIKVYRGENLVFSGDFSEPVELGRQARSDEPLYVAQKQDGKYRVSVAEVGKEYRLPVGEITEQSVSRQAVVLHPRPGGRVGLENEATRNSILLFEEIVVDGRSSVIAVDGRSSVEVSLPTEFMLGPVTIKVSSACGAAPGK